MIESRMIKCSNCNHRLVCGHRNCSFEFRNDMKICSDDVEICIGKNKPFYSDVEIHFEGGEPLRGKTKIKHITIMFSDQLKEVCDKNEP